MPRFNHASYIMFQQTLWLIRGPLRWSHGWENDKKKVLIANGGEIVSRMPTHFTSYRPTKPLWR
jgi:hypothetical protein